MSAPYRPKVFISYSARLRAGVSAVDADLSKSFCKNLADALRAANFEVLVDQGIKPNEEWESVINDWLWKCDAAVMLLSEAALQSDWVQCEGFVLAQRWKFHQGKSPGSFRLILVPFPGLTLDHFDKAYPVRLSVIQSLSFSSPDQSSEVLGSICTALEPLSARAQHFLEEHLVNLLLQNGSPSLLEAIARVLPGCSPVGVGLEPYQHVARSLLEMVGSLGRERLGWFWKVVRTLWALCNRFAVEEVVRCAMPFCWVDPRTAIELHRAAVKKGLPAIAWARSWCESEGMHLGRAFCERNYVLVDTDEQAGLPEGVHQHVRHCLAQQLLGDGQLPELEIREALREMHEDNRFVFVRVPLGTLEPGEVRELISFWPEVTFFFYLDRSRAPEDTLEPHLEGVGVTTLDLDQQSERTARWHFYQYLRSPGGVSA